MDLAPAAAESRGHLGDLRLLGLATGKHEALGAFRPLEWMPLYLSPMKEALRPFKMNPKYPPLHQLRHDAVCTTLATLCGTGVEVLLCCGAARHWWPTSSLREAPLWNLGWALSIVHWRLPDLGKLLYKHVHAQHHKSYLPTAFSGTNMHPVEVTGRPKPPESGEDHGEIIDFEWIRIMFDAFEGISRLRKATLYYLMPSLFAAVCLKLHPAVPLGCIFDCAVGAWLGHDGFHWPGAGVPWPRFPSPEE